MMALISLVLYCTLGAVLVWSGVNAVKNPVNFIAIMALVVLIDAVSGIRALYY